MSNSQSNLDNATITPQELAERFAILSENQMQRLRDGQTLTVKNVEISTFLDMSDTQDSRVGRVLFNVLAPESAKELDEESFVEDGQQKINWSDLRDVNLATAQYTHWEDDGPMKSANKRQTATVTLELDRFQTADGEDAEGILVVDYTPEAESATGNFFSQTPTGEKPSSIDAESSEDDEDSDEDTEEPSEEPKRTTA